MSIIGYARVSTDGQTVDAQVDELKRAGAKPIFRETRSGALRERTQLDRALASVHQGDVLVVTRLDRLARSTRDLLNILGAIADRGGGFDPFGMRGQIRRPRTAASC
jgi:DNA invertase Pin-like site-specific DNA recombinase